MTVIVIEESKNIPHTSKLVFKLLKKYEEISWWNYIVSSRCPRCHRIFLSSTERKYCSKKCQYNKLNH